MSKTRQHILATALAAVVPALASGQVLNPTVEVTNAYEGGASSIVKPLQKMTVPDSVMTFNLDFDYSVFDKPYQGAYEFRPYRVRLNPRPAVSTENVLYLRAGAGFTLHPELDLVWTPFRRDRFDVNVYASHHSYLGRYHVIDALQEGDGRVFKSNGDKMNGFLTDTRVGVNGRYGWSSGSAMLDVSWRNRMADDAFVFQKESGIAVDGRVQSLPSELPHFLYDAAVTYHFLGNACSWDLGLPEAVGSRFTESYFALDGTFGPVLGPDRRVVADLDLDLVRYGGTDVPAYTGLLSITPKYEFALDNWRFSLGVKVASMIYSNEWPKETQYKSGYVYPALRVDWRLLDDRLILQASATGGDRLNTRSDRFLFRPFTPVTNLAPSLERVRAMLGVRGSIAGKFRYDLQAGYARWSRAELDGFLIDGGKYRPTLFHSAFNLVFAELEYGWKSDHITVDGKMAYRYTDVQADGVFAPAAFTGTIRPAWNWGDRFKAGLDAAWSTHRTSSYRDVPFAVPGWLDLGLFAEYRFTRHFGFWAKGGNLLGQAVQRMPLHAEAGMYFTAGILLNF